MRSKPLEQHRLSKNATSQNIVRSLFSRRATAVQAAAGRGNLADWRKAHPGSPRLRSGVVAFMRCGTIPAGVPNAAAIVEQVERALTQMVRDLGIPKTNLSAEQSRILRDQRRTMTCSALLMGFIYRGGTITEDEGQLMDRLNARARRNFVKLQATDLRIDKLLVGFSSEISERIGWGTHERCN